MLEMCDVAPHPAGTMSFDYRQQKFCNSDSKTLFSSLHICDGLTNRIYKVNGTFEIIPLISLVPIFPRLSFNAPPGVTNRRNDGSY